MTSIWKQANTYQQEHGDFNAERIYFHHRCNNAKNRFTEQHRGLINENLTKIKGLRLENYRKRYFKIEATPLKIKEFDIKHQDRISRDTSYCLTSITKAGWDN